MPRIVVKLSVIFLPMFIALSCGKSEHVSHTESVAYTQKKWPNPKNIRVCITNREEVDSDLFEDIKAWVYNDYFVKTGVGFTYWGACTKEDLSKEVIRVTFNLVHDWDNSKRVSAGGGLSRLGPSNLACNTNCGNGTMRLDIGSGGRYPQPNFIHYDFVVRRTRAAAIHEFGHAMGLAHEHERSDAPLCKDYTDKVEQGDKYAYVGEFDADSIMNYCKASHLSSLSQGDVETIGWLYPLAKEPRAF